MTVLTPTKRARVCVYREQGCSYHKIGLLLGCHPSTAKRAYDKFKDQRDFYRPIPNRGRPKLLDPADQRIACRLVRSGKADTAADVQRDHFPEVSARTMRRTLAANGLNGRRKRKVQFLSKTHRRKRVLFAEDHEDWTLEDWKAVVWSDESKFNIWGSDGIQYCRRGPNEEFEERNVVQRVKHGGGSVMVWGCITSKGFGRLIRVQGIMDRFQFVEILKEGLLGTLDDHNIDPASIYFQQDNDPKHTSKLAKEFLANHGIDPLTWPPQSPDINVIENGWTKLEHAVNRRPRRPKNEDELFEVLQEEWANLPRDYLEHLYESASRRVNDVMLAKGAWIKY